MKQVAKDHKPSSAFELVDAELQAKESTSIGKLPRNKRQVSDIRKKLFAEQPTDDLAIMMEKCKCTEPGAPQFVRSVQAAPQPLCVLATDLQLKQVQFCCTDPENFSVLSIDPTFNLGAFYVTPIVFLHKAFVCKRTGNPPVFLGPVLVHQRMNTEAYSYFAYQLQILLPSLRHIKAFGTDGEKALVNAFENAYPDAIHLRCFKHFRDNIERKLKSLNFDSTTCEEILADIFGTVDSEQTQLGLVDATDSDDFASKLMALQDRWNELELTGKQVVPSQFGSCEPEFYDWFISEESSVVRNHMIQSVRSEAKLGEPPEKFFTNASECINNVLKIKVDRKSQSLTQFVDHMSELASIYEKNIDRAFSHRGDWRLSNSFQFCNDSKGKSALKEIKESLCDISEYFAKNSSECTVTTQSSTAAASQSSSTMTVNETAVTSPGLSLSYDVLQVSGCKIHIDTLKGIWKKAVSLVADKSLIVTVPGGATSSYSRMVASSSGDCPHMVTTPAKFSGQFKCDSKCPMFSTYKLCAHTIAVAEVNGRLHEFTQWLIKQKCTPNYSKLALHGLPRGAGEKGGGTQKKNSTKRKTNATAKTVVDRLAFANKQNPVGSTRDPSEDDRSCFVSAVGSMQNKWLSPSISNSHLYGHSSNMMNNMMFGMPPQMPMPFPPTWPLSPSANAWQPPTSHVISPYPFTLKMLTGRIQVCQSCRIPFRSSSTEPPYDLVIARKECRPYRGQGGESKTPSTPSNSHYHVSLNCICAAEPSFCARELVIPDEVLECLSDTHKGFLFATLGVTI